MRHALYLAVALIMAGGPARAGDDLVTVMSNACAAARNAIDVLRTHRTPTSPTFAELAKLRADWGRNCAPWIAAAAKPPSVPAATPPAKTDNRTAFNDLMKRLRPPDLTPADTAKFEKLLRTLPDQP